MTIGKLKQKAQVAFNEFIRERDLSGDHFKCISCGEIKHEKYMHAGHYYNVGHFDGLRFDEDNCHGQCNYCNTFLHGNLIEYGQNLPLKIGLERLEALKNKAATYKRIGYKFSRTEVEEIITRYREKVKKIKVQ